jgi:hypothetical protein
MSEQQFLWNSLDGGENVFIKERGSDKSIHIKIIEGKYEFVDFMKKVNEQQATISQLEEEKGYWKNKAMTLLMQVRRLTPRMTDKEVREFAKELDDE